MQVVNFLSVTYLQLFLARPDVPLKQMVLFQKTIAEVPAPCTRDQGAHHWNMRCSSKPSTAAWVTGLMIWGIVYRFSF